VKKYALTSNNFKGEIICTYNDDDLLVNFDLTGAELTAEQQQYFFMHPAVNVSELEALTNKAKSLRVQELHEKIDFVAFWNKYDDKINSSRKRTLAKWNKMSDCDRARAYQYIFKYFASIPSGTRKKYAETYLNAELWNN
jgi:hypothetical protein